MKSLTILLFSGLLAGSVLAQSTTLYQSQPGFQGLNSGPSPLAGQGGWLSGANYSPSPGWVVDSNNGNFNVVKLFGPLVPSDGSGYSCDFYEPLSDYNPQAENDPVVSVTADVCMNLGPAASQSSYVFGFVVLKDQNGNAFESMGIDKNGVIFGQNFANPNQVVTASLSGTNMYHILRADLNFSTRRVTFYVDNLNYGSMAFNPNASNTLGSVDLLLQGSNPLDSNFLIENLSVTAQPALPEPNPNGCAIKIDKAESCIGNGTPGIPAVGDPYGLIVKYTVTGAPVPGRMYRIKYIMGNVVEYSDWMTLATGTYEYTRLWDVNCDSALLWSVTIDPDGVTESTTPSTMIMGGTFTPKPPSKKVEAYDTLTMVGMEQAVLSIPPGSAPSLLFGWPTSHGAQNISSVTASPYSNVVHDTYNVPVNVLNFDAVSGSSSLVETETFVAHLSNLKVNPAVLRAVTWSQISAQPSSVTQWLAPDSQCESTSLQVANFVQQYLGTNYRATITPYDVVRALQRAVSRTIIWQGIHPPEDADNCLVTHLADCGGYASLLTAALRNAGIPARRLEGFWWGDSFPGANSSSWHERVEFHLPGAGWLVADADKGCDYDPTTIYTPELGFTPDAHVFVAMDTGDSHSIPSFGLESFPGLQLPEWFNCYANVYQYLGLKARLSVSGFTGRPPYRMEDLTASNMPGNGTVSLQSFTHGHWATVDTVPAQGQDVSFEEPFAAGGHTASYRLIQNP